MKTDFECVAIEAEHAAASSVFDDVADWPSLEDTSLVKEHDRLVVRQTRVDHHSKPPQGAAALETRDEIVGHAHTLDRVAEHELVRVEVHRFVGADFDQFHQVIGGLLDVDERAFRIAEDQELVVEADVDARWLHERRIEGIDPETAAGDGFFDRAVRQNHRVARGAATPASVALVWLARSIRRRTSSSNDEMSAKARYTDAKRI